MNAYTAIVIVPLAVIGLVVIGWLAEMIRDARRNLKG